jgi:hypothetical protein
MPKILEGVKDDDDLVGGVDITRYSNHVMYDAVKFPYLVPQTYLESRG